jgi:preprotein translocase subunit SecA
VRKHLLEYDDVMNKQRENIYSLRRQLLEGSIKLTDENDQEEVLDTREYVMMLAEDLLDSSIETFAPRQGDLESWDLDALKREIGRLFAIDPATLDFSNLTSDEIRDMLWERIQKSYTDKETLVGREVLQRVERDIMLQVVDGQWKDHLYSLDHLKEGIGLRGYGQRDPLVEYKKESFSLFQAMKDRVDEESVRYMWWLRPVLSDEGEAGVPAAPRRPAPRQPPPRRPPLVLNDPAAETASAFAAARPQPAFAGAAAPAASGRSAPAPARVGGDDAAVKTVRRDEPKVGRNDPCPCGSGKKYKKCHGAAA